MKSVDSSNSVPLNTLIDTPDENKFLVVGIGASAGGIQALKEFFENVPADSGIAYVAILHLSPDHDSQLAQVLQLVTPIPVSQVTEKTEIQPNHAYVIPPNQHLTMEDNFIVVSPNLFIEDRRAPVDIFFRTLAESYKAMAVGVVLSGTGANGSMGLKRIKERGGAVYVQNPREAEFNEMPRNAIATELIDEVLPVATIPGKIIAYKSSIGTVRISVEAEKRPEEQQLALREIFTQLRLRTGNDFSNYKRPTLLRRIERRISIHSLPGLPEYAAYMQANPDETMALLKDLLISVTNFFRDKGAWNVLETDVLPNLLKGKTVESSLRIWVAGCATGEEAYSIAMLCAEQTVGVLDAPKVQIFASDIDEAAIAHAREGLYTLNDAADVSTERLRRFFNKEGESYRVRREIREMVMFAHHNFIKDPPFSHLDIITCRNVLIYFNQIAQERVAETFHFALEPGGYLFLGSSESFDSAIDLYASYNREHHIFQTRQVQTRFYPLPESVPTYQVEKLSIQGSATASGKKGRDRITYGDLHQRLLEEYAPPSIVVNEEYDIVHVSEKAGRFLQVSGGELSPNIMKMVMPELRLELRSALLQSTEQKAIVKTKPLQVTIADQVEMLIVHIRPVLQQESAGHGFILVLFEQVTIGEEVTEVVFTTNEPANRRLEEELMRLKQQLRSTIEQYEFQSEELKASNEELQAMNEELRSAAEELETSKEELQSINEEMRTVNQELKIKIDETSLSSNNLHNLINSTDIGTIFLDRSLRVKMFTPSTARIFNLISADFGRPLSDITHRLTYNDIDVDAEMVLGTLQTVEREVYTYDDQVFLMRALPYRTSEDRINGVVITFVDITERKQAEDQVLESHRRTVEILESISDAFYAVDADFKFTYVNKKAEEWWERKHESLIGKNYWTEFPEAADSDSFNLHLKAVKEKKVIHYETVSPVLKRWVDVSIYPDATGGLSVYFRDIHERKESEEALKESEERLRLFVNTSSDAIYSMSADWVVMRSLKGNNFIQSTNIPDQVWMKQYIPQEDWPFVSATIQTAIDTKSIFKLEHRVIRVDGSYGWAHSRAVPMLNDQYEITEWFGSATDITASKQAKEDLIGSENRFRTLTNVVPQLIWTNDENSKADFFNQRWYEYSGLTYEESVGLGWEAIVHLEDAPIATERWHKAIAAEETFDTEYRLRRADGVYRWHIGRNTPLQNAEGKVISWFGSATDIEDIKVAQQAMHTSEDRLRITMASATDYAIITTNTEGIIEAWSTGAERIFGYLSEEIIGQLASIIFTPEDRAIGAPEQEMQTAREEGRAADERWHLRKDGSRFFASGVMTPIQNVHLTGYVKVARDMTEQRAAEEALRLSEERYRTVIESANLGAWDWNIPENKVIWNKEHFTMLGADYNHQPMDAEYFLHFIHPDDAERVRNTLFEAVASNGTYQCEFRILRDDNGEVRWMSGFGRVAAVENGQAIRMVGVMSDITERKAMEQQKDDFIGIASHELKTPVTSIKAYTQILLDTFEKTDDTRSVRLMQKMEGQVDRLTGLIGNLLDTTKIAEGQLPLHIETFELNDLVEERIEDLQRLSQAHKLVIKECKEVKLTADWERIGQVITNLVSNAIKYSPQGEEVTISCQQAGDTITVSVQDRGIGISEEAQQKVFDRFFRVKDTHMQTFPGMGLGLYITAGIIQRHGGTINVKSKLGEGSVFSFTIPINTNL